MCGKELAVESDRDDSAGGALGETEHPPLPSSGITGSETERVAGKKMEVGIVSGSLTDPAGSPESGNVSPTKQVWLRLPEDFATLLKRQPPSDRRLMFLAVVFSQMGTTYAPSEFFAAVEHLQRISVLLQCALERDLPDDRVIAVRQVIKLINQLCRETRVGDVKVRLRLPNVYADVLLSLPPVNRERMIRLAVRAGAASISLQQLVLKAAVLHGLRIRLQIKLDSGSTASPEWDVTELVDVICNLRNSPQEGGLP